VAAVGTPLKNFFKAEGFALCRCNVGEEACKLGRQMWVDVFCSWCYAGSGGRTRGGSVGRAGRDACRRSSSCAGGGGVRAGRNGFAACGSGRAGAFRRNAGRSHASVTQSLLRSDTSRLKDVRGGASPWASAVTNCVAAAASAQNSCMATVSIQMIDGARMGINSGLRAILLCRRAVKFVTTLVVLMQVWQDGQKAARGSR
jgi:hypothetical protein